MSICNSCRTPGNCCNGFVLNFKVSLGNWYDESRMKLQEHNISYIYPIRPVNYSGEDQVQVQFGCAQLGSDGRCLDYENRPDLCRSYQPQQDALCCEYRYKLKGIPIVFKH